MTTKNAIKDLSESDLLADKKAFEFCKNTLMQSIIESDVEENDKMYEAIGVTQEDYDALNEKFAANFMRLYMCPTVSEQLLIMLKMSNSLVEFSMYNLLYMKMREKLQKNLSPMAGLVDILTRMEGGR